jgi:hypothetical protein
MPGWVIVYAGRNSDPAWGLPVMMLINGVIYAVPFYAYGKAFKEVKDA